jgi:GT2 family glycosyltransferase
MRTAALSRVSKFEWRSVSDDPQFQFSFRLLRPRYLLLYLESLDRDLDPVLYFNRGDGFREEDSAALPHSHAVVYAISISSLPNVTGVRFDPASRLSRFKFWARSIYRDGGLDVVAEKIARSAVKAGGKPPTWYRIGDEYAISPPASRIGAAQNVRRHFDFVWRLAQVQLAENTSKSVDRPTGDILISLVVPTFNTPPRYLTDLVDSFRRQGAEDVELLLVDDGSTRADTRKALTRLSKVAAVSCLANGRNEGIAAAANKGMAQAQGRWVGFIDHDDALAPSALMRLKQALGEFPAAKFFYTDEVITDGALEPKGYILKPAFDRVLLSGVNYINHFSLYRRDLLAEIGGFRSGFDGSQDYDLLLRYTRQLSDDEVVHVPYPAYLWRRTPSTFSATHQAQCLANARRALTDHFRTTAADVRVEPALDTSLHRPRFDVAIRRWPPVTVIIPNRNGFELISNVIDGLQSRTDYPDLEIIVVDNGSDDQRVLSLYDTVRQANPRFRAIIEPQPFNFSRQVNIGIRHTSRGHILLLNNDVEIVSPDWLKEMISCLAYPDAGIVGARLLYPNHTIQHAGVIVGLGGLAGHWFERKPHSHPGPFGRLRVRQSLSAVTAACMLISRECLEQVGEFDEHLFAIAYNDVDYCMRATMRGFRTIWTPNVTLVHHESASRGSDEAEHNRERFSREKEALRQRHFTEDFVDPYFNPWYTKDQSDPGLALLSGLPSARSGRPARANAEMPSGLVARAESIDVEMNSVGDV